MKRTFAALASAGLLSFGLTACGGGTDFCELDPDSFNVDPSDPQSAIDALKEIRDDAPSEIQDDIDVLIEEVDGVDLTDPAAATEVDIEALGTAAENLSTWEDENC